jgi:hypothetical protein
MFVWIYSPARILDRYKAFFWRVRLMAGDLDEVSSGYCPKVLSTMEGNYDDWKWGERMDSFIVI